MDDAKRLKKEAKAAKKEAKRAKQAAKAAKKEAKRARMAAYRRSHGNGNGGNGG